MYSNITGLSIGFGITLGLSTLCSQAYGAKNYFLVGVWAQRGALMLTFIMCPVIISLWIWASAPVFKLIGSICGSAVILIIPGALWLRHGTGARTSPTRLGPAVSLIVVGVFIFGAGSVLTLQDMLGGTGS